MPRNIETRNPGAMNFLRKHAVATSLGVVGLLGVGAGAFWVANGAKGVGTSEHNETPKPTPSSSEQATNPDAIEGFPISTVEDDTFAALSPEQQETIRTLEGLDLNAFRSLPEEEQEAFAWHVYEENLSYAEDRLKKQGYGDLIEAAKKDGPEGASGKADLIWAVIQSLKTGSYSEGIGYDTLTAQKMLVLIVSTNPEDPTSQQILGGLDSVIANNVSVNTPTTWDSPFTGGVTTEFGTYICNEGENIQTTYAETTFQTIDGKSVTIPRQTLSVDSSDPRYIQNLA